MQVSYLPDAERHPLWPEIRELLKPAAEFGGIPAKDEDELVWVAFDGRTVFGVVTTLAWNDGEVEIRCVAGTRFRDWGREMEAVICRWARDCGATRLTARGRKGWARIYRAFGWVASGTDEDGRLMFEKEL